MTAFARVFPGKHERRTLVRELRSTGMSDHCVQVLQGAGGVCGEPMLGRGYWTDVAPCKFHGKGHPKAPGLLALRQCLRVVNVAGESRTKQQRGSILVPLPR
jgi:hypothetical protein